MPEMEIVYDSDEIGECPACRYRPPDSRLSNAWDWGEDIREGDSRAQGKDCQDDRHTRAADGPVISVQYEEQPDSYVERSFYFQVFCSGADDLRFPSAYKDLH